MIYLHLIWFNITSLCVAIHNLHHLEENTTFRQSSSLENGETGGWNYIPLSKIPTFCLGRSCNMKYLYGEGITNLYKGYYLLNRWILLRMEINTFLLKMQFMQYLEAGWNNLSPATGEIKESEELDHPSSHWKWEHLISHTHTQRSVLVHQFISLRTIHDLSYIWPLCMKFCNQSYTYSFFKFTLEGLPWWPRYIRLNYKGPGFNPWQGANLACLKQDLVQPNK